MKGIKKYQLTIEQIAEIVFLCINQTIAGNGCRKDWTHNVKRALEKLERTIDEEKEDKNSI